MLQGAAFRRCAVVTSGVRRACHDRDIRASVPSGIPASDRAAGDDRVDAGFPKREPASSYRDGESRRITG